MDLRVAAEHVVLDPTLTANAALVREHLVAAAAAIGGAPQAQLDSLQQMAATIGPDQPLTEQLAALRRFFVAAADSLAGDPTSMSRSAVSAAGMCSVGSPG